MIQADCGADGQLHRNEQVLFHQNIKGTENGVRTPANHVWDVRFGDQSFHTDLVTKEQHLSLDQARSRTKERPLCSVCQTQVEPSDFQVPYILDW